MSAAIKNGYCFPYGEKNQEWPQIFAIFVVSLGSLTSGIQFGWTSPSIPILTSNSSHIEPISFAQASYLAVLQPICLGLASPFVGVLLGYVGRKKTVLFMTVPQFVSWLVIYFAQNIHVLYLASVLSGIGHAFFFNAIPTYIGEITEPHVRGSWANLISVNIYFGQFLINVIGSCYNIKTTAVIFGVLPIINFALILLLPESPYYLLMKSKVIAAENALRKLRWKEDVEQELKTLKKYVQQQSSNLGTFRDLFTIASNRKALLICTAARGIQQFSGVPALAMYTQYMFLQVGGSLAASTSAIIYNAVWTLTIILSSTVSDKFGRRPLMIFSCMSCGIILVVEATYFYIDLETTVDVSKFTWIPLAGLILFILVNSAGLGIVPNLLLTELFSTKIKGKAMAFSNICFAICVVIVSKAFQVLTTGFGMYAPFYLFSVSCFAGVFFSHYYVPETKRKTLEEIQIILKGHSSPDSKLMEDN